MPLKSKLDRSTLRVQVVATRHVSPTAAARLIDGELSAILCRLVGEHHVYDRDRDSTERQGIWLAELTQSDLTEWEEPSDALFRCAEERILAEPPETIEILDFDGDRIYALQSDQDPLLAARVLRAPETFSAIVPVGPKGIVFGVPDLHHVFAFPVGSIAMETGLDLIVTHIHAVYEADDDLAVSPWLYWHDGTRIEEFGYDRDDEGDLASVNLPNALLDELHRE